MSNASKRFVGGFVVALMGAVGFTNIYLPYFSPAAKERRARREAGELGGEQHVGGPGSMWQNVSETAATPGGSSERKERLMAEARQRAEELVRSRKEREERERAARGEAL